MILTSSESNDTAAAGTNPLRANYGATSIHDRGGEGGGQDNKANVNAPELYSDAGSTCDEELMVSTGEAHRALGPRLTFALAMFFAAAGLFYCSSHRWRSNITAMFVQEDVPIEGESVCSTPQGSFRDSCNVFQSTYDGGLCTFVACCALGEDQKCAINVGTYQPSETPELSNTYGCLEGGGWNEQFCEWNADYAKFDCAFDRGDVFCA